MISYSKGFSYPNLIFFEYLSISIYQIRYYFNVMTDIFCTELRKLIIFRV